MNRQIINQNVDNNAFNGTISTIYSISISNSQELTDDTNHNHQDNNSNWNYDGAIQENAELGNFMQPNYHNENVEGNEDERIHYFDISRINSNRTN